MTSRRFVYFIKPIGMDGPIKIGCANKPEQRLIDLMSWCPFPLKIMATVPGGFAEERRLHQMFAADRLRAEWFRTTRELLGFIETIRETGSLPFEVVGDKRSVCSGLPAVLSRHGISKEAFAARAGVLPTAVDMWSKQVSIYSIGRILATFDSLGVCCSAEELRDAS